MARATRRSDAASISANVDLGKVALDLTLRAYDNHKNHARFQETQRSWIFLAYFSISGIMFTGIVSNFVKDGSFSKDALNAVHLILLFHILIGGCVGLAISKLSREFRRHFRQAERIVTYFQTSSDVPSAARGALAIAQLGTSGDDHRGWKRLVAKRLGVASLHNYIISMFLGADAGLLTISNNYDSRSAYIMALLFAVFSAAILYYYNRLMDTQ